ncbi:uncharacterized protein ACLA_088310 [Aspergillus clavatus NRRL 1]|uniref:Uncharacterized protein n=1 Tax=Aspergillus clavatus (strain ATCC 1007 / CBS 513.65 / DSM 816 / NCTC 3887 / NRRL 1 / QM 1276 / 107) TaxID=344612 RepID=A1CE43_ASPCL|nr:uncharacterized protein ACLA_088310 [Aspergillus clavatus NRRL 1]EAW11142.1 hypothetical protein ACLA_088310 [Aspergillus clavatus NRRL 1]
MLDIQTAGNAVWDPNSLPRRKSSSTTETATTDLLPPFPLLASDEERERKARTSRPGTYHVVVVPESFSHLPEYIENGPGEEPKDRLSSSLSSVTETDQFTNDREAADPHVVILKRFKDAKRSPSSQCRSPAHSPTSDLCESSLSAATLDATSQDTTDDDPMHDPLESENQDAVLLAHFRDLVWVQLVPAGGIFDIAGGDVLSADVFDREAITFPPLFHAMMAISALSLDQKNGGHNIDGLRYYHQAFLSLQNSIRSDEDLLSDGLFLTHFLLLAYELAVAELNGSNLWSHHVSRILHISSLRRAMFRIERYPSILWWVCTVDLYALLSGAGTGSFVRAAMENSDLLPEPGLFQLPVRLDGYRSVSPEDDRLRVLFRLHHDTFMLAARFGFLAADSRGVSMPVPYAQQDQGRSEAEQLRDALWRVWGSPEAQFMVQAQETLPRALQEILRQSSLLFHTSLLFSHTSLWPGQHLGREAASEEEIHHHAIAILNLAESTMARGKEIGRRFVTFPLFLAGSTVSSSDVKSMVLEMLSGLEAEEFGRNAATTRYILQVVYERQMQQSQDGGPVWGIDWTDLLAAHGLPLVTFG